MVTLLLVVFVDHGRCVARACCSCNVFNTSPPLRSLRLPLLPYPAASTEAAKPESGYGTYHHIGGRRFRHGCTGERGSYHNATAPALQPQRHFPGTSALRVTSILTQMQTCVRAVGA